MLRSLAILRTQSLDHFLKRLSHDLGASASRIDHRADVIALRFHCWMHRSNGIRIDTNRCAVWMREDHQRRGLRMSRIDEGKLSVQPEGRSNGCRCQETPARHG